MPAVCRIGHADIPHCSGMVRQGGSSNVFVNGIGISNLLFSISFNNFFNIF